MNFCKRRFDFNRRKLITIFFSYYTFLSHSNENLSRYLVKILLYVYKIYLEHKLK